MKTIKEIFDLDEKRTGGEWLVRKANPTVGGIKYGVGLNIDGHLGWLDDDYDNSAYIAAMPDAVKHLRRMVETLEFIADANNYDWIKDAEGKTCMLWSNKTDLINFARKGIGLEPHWPDKCFEKEMEEFKLKNALQLNEANDE